MATGSMEAGTPVPLDARAEVTEVTPVSAPAPDGEAQTCTSCGGANATGARFCHECGASLGAAAPVATLGTAAAGVAGANAGPNTRPTLEPTVFDQSVAASSASGSSRVSPQVLEVGMADSDSARTLLDRAFNLAERGDMTGAILACRQSVALSPTSPQGFSMLGLLLERSGDLEQAAAAYARVLKLAPGSQLEVESLDRIRSTLSARRGEAPVFRFDGRELDEAVGVPVGVPASVSSSKASSVVPVVPVAAVAAAGVSTAGISSAGTSPSTALPNSSRPVDVAMPHSAQNLQAGLAAPNISAMHFDVADMGPAPWWQRALIRPTAFTRGLPLAAVAGTGLLFMMWGRSSAVSSYAQSTAVPAGLNAAPIEQSSAPTPPDGSVVQDPSGGLSQNPVAPNSPPGAQSVAPSVAGSGDAYPITNRPAVSPEAASANPGASSAPVSVGGSPGGGSVSGPSQARPAAPGNVAAPAAPRVQPVFPATRRVVPPAIPSNLPPMRVPPPAPQSAPSVTLPRGGGGLSSSGGGPLNTSASRTSGSITLTRPRYSATAAPPRPSNIAAETERRAGLRRPENAVPAIRNGEGTGWSYQTRALAFLERGDYSRAADDFQLAISAYRDQIGRGERVAEAQAGLRASQSGLSLAQGSLRR